MMTDNSKFNVKSNPPDSIEHDDVVNAPGDEATHPAAEVQKLRPAILIIIIIAVLAVVVMIIFNIFNVKKRPDAQPAPPHAALGSNQSTKWFEHEKMQKPIASAPALAMVKNPNGTIASAPVTDQVASQGTQQVSQMTQEEQQAVQDLKASMKAPISQNEITPQSGNGAVGVGSTTAAGGGAGGSLASGGQDTSGLPKDDQNMTAEKRNFIKNNTDMSANVLSTSVNNPVASLVLAMGAQIPAILDKEINSELPGQIYGHVSRDVYDTRTHSKLLIPAGSNLVGNYDSAIAYGQTRLLVAWKRVNFPNGQWIDIQGMGGADPVGAGFGDKVDNHYWQILGATMITSVLAAGAQLAQPQQSNALQSPGVGQTIGQSVGTQISSTGTQLVQKTINLQPTIHIRAGFEFTVEVNKDIAFAAPYTGNSNKN